MKFSRKGEMLFFDGKIINLDDFSTLIYEGKGPDDFSFLGVVDNHTHENHEIHTNRVHHALILHDGSKTRLHVQYVTGHDDEIKYDERIIDDTNCCFFPKATVCFLPRLVISYAEDDEIFCYFKGGDQSTSKMIQEQTDEERANLLEQRKYETEIGTTARLTPNPTRQVHTFGHRVCLILDMQPSSIAAFLDHDEPIPILQEGSIFHPATINKKAGLLWPIFPAHQSLLRKSLPILVETHHAIANYDERFHNTRNFIGYAISSELQKMVRIEVSFCFLINF